MNPGSQLRQRRQALGLTQSALAAQSGVSLPSIQIIESDRGNPSWDTLSLLAETLGLELKLAPAACDWDRLAALGAPLMSEERQAFPRTIDALQREIARALTAPRTERQQEALIALLAALRDHYPQVFARCYRRSPQVQDLLETPIQGRLIRLRRLAASALAEYL